MGEEDYIRVDTIRLDAVNGFPTLCGEKLTHDQAYAALGRLAADRMRNLPDPEDVSSEDLRCFANWVGGTVAMLDALDKAGAFQFELTLSSEEQS